jgi:hypothetical protein
MDLLNNLELLADLELFVEIRPRQQQQQQKKKKKKSTTKQKKR